MVVTQRQREVLAFIRSFIDERGFSPTLREIAAALSMTSTNAVNCHLNALRRKGLIERDPFLARSIRVQGMGKPSIAFYETLSAAMQLTPSERRELIGNLERSL